MFEIISTLKILKKMWLEVIDFLTVSNGINFITGI